MHIGKVLMNFCYLLSFKKKSFRHTISESNSLNPDQARQNDRPELGSNCLQKLSVDDNNRQIVLIHKVPPTICSRRRLQILLLFQK